MSVFFHAQGIKNVHAGRRVKKWQNSVHVVIEQPPNNGCSHEQRTHIDKICAESAV